MKRVGISNRKRFEIFKRDAFVCAYCGGHPPKVILNVDHIVAVANGGTNDAHNLVTSCFECNSGKSDVPLSIAPQSLSERAALVKEREAQLLGFRDVIQAQQDRIDDDAWEVVYELFGDGYEPLKDWFRSIKMFGDKLDHHDVMDSANMAATERFHESRMFRYFCAICWRKIKDKGVE
jgi:hypothetical protein